MVRDARRCRAPHHGEERASRRPHPEEARSAVSKDEATELENARANHSGAKTQHPRQMLRIWRSSSLSRSLTVALSSRSRTVSLAARRDLTVAYRVRLVLTARCTGKGRKAGGCEHPFRPGSNGHRHRIMAAGGSRWTLRASPAHGHPA